MIHIEHDKGNKYFFCYVDVDDEKIYGNFTLAQYENAVNTFIQKNYNALINPMMNERNEQGKKVYNAQSAIAEIKKKYMQYKK